jgi:ribosomal-protein-alanine N-acetyltransferase
MTTAVSLQFRLATANDVDDILDIEQQSFPFPWSLFSLLEELNNPLSTVLLTGPTLPAIWRLWAYIIYLTVADEMHIHNLAVHPTQRRQGIGRALLQESLRRVRFCLTENGKYETDNRIKTVWLEVRPSNRAALALYYSLGFQHVATRPRYYSDTGEDALVLYLKFDD